MRREHRVCQGNGPHLVYVHNNYWSPAMQNSASAERKYCRHMILFENRIQINKSCLAKSIVSNPRLFIAFASVFSSVFVLLNTEPVLAQGRNDLIAITGRTVADGNGRYSFFGTPALNNNSQVAFMGIATNTSGGTSDDIGYYMGTASGIIQIAREGQAAPDGNGVFGQTSQGNPIISDSGSVSFRIGLIGTSGGSSDDRAIYFGSGGAWTEVVREGAVAPDGNGAFSLLNNEAIPINSNNVCAFYATLSGTTGGSSDDTGLFIGDGSRVTQIIREGQLAPDGDGTYNNFQFSNPELNNLNQVAFVSSLNNTSGGTSNDFGMYLGDQFGVSQIVRERQAAPDGNGTFNQFSMPVLNNNGQVAFNATFNGTSGGSLDNGGVYRATTSGITRIAREGDIAPDGNGNFNSFNAPRIGDGGHVAFTGGLINTSRGASDNSGVFRGAGGALVQVAREGQIVPGGNGEFSTFTLPGVNQWGAVAFTGLLRNTAGGTSDDRAIYVGDGTDLIQVAREGDSFNTSQITFLSFDWRRGFNEYGQIAYQATMADGTDSIQLWTPDIHWRAPGGGSWQTANNWTLGIRPDKVHDVFIDPSSAVTVFGPTGPAHVRNLQVGGGSGVATLDLQSGDPLTVEEQMIILSGSSLSGDGTIVGNVVNEGVIAPGSSNGELSFTHLTLAGSSEVDLIIRNTSLFDRLSVSDELLLDGSLAISFLNEQTVSENQSYRIIDFSGSSFSGEFDGLGEGSLVGNFNGVDLFITYAGGDGNDVELYTSSAIPEPASASVILAVSVVTILHRRRRKQT